MSVAGYVIWFVTTIVAVIAILVFGILMATGTKIRRRDKLWPKSPDRCLLR